MRTIIYTLAIVIIFFSCSGDNAGTGSEKQSSKVAEQHAIPQERTNPDSKPAAIYSENVDSETGRLNNWKFTVALYETNKTFTYRLQIQYAELNITDSLLLPDLGVAPQPVLQKGKDKYSCVIGFMDNRNIFKDYKLVSVTNGNLRIHTLKYYSVQRTPTVQ